MFVSHEAVLQSMRKGDSMRKLGPGCWSDKTQLMVWCLHEALLQSEQNALRSSVTISLARDARRSRLMVRFGSCSNLFKIRVGLLGVERGGGDRAGQIVESTRAIITRFCSKWAKPPRWFNGPEPFFDKELFQMVPLLHFTALFFQYIYIIYIYSFLFFSTPPNHDQ